MGGVGGVSTHTSPSNSRKRFIPRVSFPFLVTSSGRTEAGGSKNCEKLQSTFAHQFYCFTEEYIITHLVCQKLPSDFHMVLTNQNVILNTKCVCWGGGGWGVFSTQDSVLNFDLIEIVELTIR